MSDTEPTITPAYLSYATFKNTIQGLALDGGLPSQIDHSVLSTMGGSTRKMFLAALRFLDLISETGEPTDHFKKLARASDSDWKDYMQVLLKEKYKDLVDDVSNASPKRFSDQFTQVFGGIGSSLVEPSIRFFVAAARDANIPVSSHITQRRVRAPGAPRGRPRKVAKQRSIPEEPRSENQGGEGQSFRLALMDKFPDFDLSWDKDQQAAWFAAFQKIMDLTENNKKEN